MPSAQINKNARPLSPHLQIYKPQFSTVTSILHRATGIALTLGLFLLAWGLVALAGGRESYEFFIGFCSSVIGQILLIGWSLAFYYHLCTGIRHLIYDSGYLFEIRNSIRSGWVVLILPVLMTLATWGYIYLGGAV